MVFSLTGILLIISLVGVFSSHQDNTDLFCGVGGRSDGWYCQLGNSVYCEGGQTTHIDSCPVGCGWNGCCNPVSESNINSFNVNLLAGLTFSLVFKP